MRKYEYETVTLGYALSKKSLTKKLQDTLDEKANEGWRLVKFDFGIAIWSDEEYLNQKSSIILETKGKDGVYRTKYVFNIAGMSKNKDVLDHYSFTFGEETYGIRIKVTTNQVNYEKNKGRVVLSDFVIRHAA